MTQERASIFDDEDLDLSDFKPATSAQSRPDAAAIRDLALEKGFVSRDPETPSPVAANAYDNGPVLRRRYTTGRNRQLNLRVTPDALRRFYALADHNGWVLGEAFEHAVTALERSLKPDD